MRNTRIRSRETIAVVETTMNAVFNPIIVLFLLFIATVLETFGERSEGWSPDRVFVLPAYVMWSIGLIRNWTMQDIKECPWSLDLVRI